MLSARGRGHKCSVRAERASSSERSPRTLGIHAVFRSHWCREVTETGKQDSYSWDFVSDWPAGKFLQESNERKGWCKAARDLSLQTGPRWGVWDQRRGVEASAPRRQHRHQKRAGDSPAPPTCCLLQLSEPPQLHPEPPPTLSPPLSPLCSHPAFLQARGPPCWRSPGSPSCTVQCNHSSAIPTLLYQSR